MWYHFWPQRTWLPNQGLFFWFPDWVHSSSEITYCSGSLFFPSSSHNVNIHTPHQPCWLTCFILLLLLLLPQEKSVKRECNKTEAWEERPCRSDNWCSLWSISNLIKTFHHIFFCYLFTYISERCTVVWKLSRGKSLAHRTSLASSQACFARNPLWPDISPSYLGQLVVNQMEKALCTFSQCSYIRLWMSPVIQIDTVDPRVARLGSWFLC